MVDWIGDKYMSVKEYANLCGITPQAVYKAIKQRRIKYYKIGKVYIIPKDAVIKTKNIRDGRYIGIKNLERGDIKGFLQKRGYSLITDEEDKEG